MSEEQTPNIVEKPEHIHGTKRSKSWALQAGVHLDAAGSPIDVAAQSASADVVSPSGQATVEGNVERFPSMWTAGSRRR